VGRVTSIIDEAQARFGAALMGVLNTTPDSFYDGGLYLGTDRARARVDELVAEGVDIIDIGGESTRPGSEPVPTQEQWARIEPTLRYSLEKGLVVSVDTSDAEVARRALALGADIVNDVSCVRDARLALVAARAQAILIVMHSREPMTRMPGYSACPDDAYTDVVADVRAEWRAGRERALGQGMPAADVWFDPGIGFNKNARHSLELLGRLAAFQSEGVPIVVGPSRKSFIAAVDPAPPEERLGGTIAACLAAVEQGARVLRVHDVRAVRQALSVHKAISRAEGGC
jgi:dihydropteroate synthase